MWFIGICENRNNETYENFWRANFRMSSNTFFEIIKLVRNSSEEQDTQFRKAIPLKKRVTIAIQRLATGISFHTIGKTFGVAKSTAFSITIDFGCEKVNLAKYFIKFQCVKSVRIRSYSGPYFPTFGLNAERYGVSLRFQSDCGKIRTRIILNMDTFHAVFLSIGRQTANSDTQIHRQNWLQFSVPKLLS